VPILIAYGAKIRLEGPKGKRDLPLENFFLIPQNAQCGPIDGSSIAEYAAPLRAPDHTKTVKAGPSFGGGWSRFVMLTLHAKPLSNEQLA
jgi:hypothetical protein